MKVFKMNDFDWVCAIDMDSAIEWYEKEYGEEIDHEEVRECDLEKEGQYIDFTDEKRIAELDVEGLSESIMPKADTGLADFGSLAKRDGDWNILVPFKDILPDNENIEPFVTATTEW